MKFGIFYEHQLPRPWTEGAEQQLFNEALDQVELADRLGIDFAWEVEHHFLEEYSHSSAPEVFLAAASQRTKNIRLGHGIVQLPTNHPARVAERVSTLDPPSMDVHLRPQSLLCRPEATTYDFVLRFSTLRTDLRRLLEVLGQSEAAAALDAASLKWASCLDDSSCVSVQLSNVSLGMSREESSRAAAADEVRAQLSRIYATDSENRRVFVY